MIYNEVLEWWSKLSIKTPSDIDKYLSNFRILFAYNSGKIENDNISLHDTREIFENGQVVNYTGNPRTIFELENQKKCYELLKYKIVKKEHLTISLIKEVHSVLTAGTYDEKRYIENSERSGEFKKHDYITGRFEVGSTCENVERDILDLIKEIEQYKGVDYLKVAAYFHAVFENIHPFADGNGRVGRTLVNYYLMVNNHPPMIIYDKDKTIYYECLEKFDEKEDINSLLEFFKYEVEQTWKKSLENKNNAIKPLNLFI